MNQQVLWELIAELIAKWRKDEAKSSRSDSYEQGRANRLLKCADELEVALAASEPRCERHGLPMLHTHLCCSACEEEAQPVAAKQKEVIADGFGSVWAKHCYCGGLNQIMRPGKIQCSAQGTPQHDNYKFPERATSGEPAREVPLGKCDIHIDDHHPQEFACVNWQPLAKPFDAAVCLLSGLLSIADAIRSRKP